MNKQLISKKQLNSHKKRLARAKSHPFIVPVVTLIGLVFFTLFGLIFFGAQTIGPSDSLVVNLYVDGEERTLSTRAKTVEDLLDRLDITVGPNDIVEPKTSARLEDNFTINIYRSRLVTIVDGNKSITKESAQQSARAVAKEAGLKLYPEDIVEAALPEDVLEQGPIREEITVERSTPIKLVLFGAPFDVRTHAQTVGQLLEEKEISPDDITVFPKVQTKIKNNAVVYVTSPGKKIITVKESIPQPEDTVEDPDLDVGVTEVREEGRPGEKVVLFEVDKNNPKKRTKLQEVVAVSPVARVVAVGTRSTLIDASNAELLRLLRECETGGNYATNTGNGYYGAYQFSAPTWFSITGYPSLPHQAPRAVQDDAALQLARRSGFHSQFPGCSSKIGLPAYPN